MKEQSQGGRVLCSLQELFLPVECTNHLGSLQPEASLKQESQHTVLARSQPIAWKERESDSPQGVPSGGRYSEYTLFANSVKSPYFSV